MTDNHDYPGEVAASLAQSDAYSVTFVERESVGIGAEYIVVAVDFDHRPTGTEVVELIRLATAPFPEGSRHNMRVGVTVAADPSYSLESTYGDWFDQALVTQSEIIGDVSQLRAGIANR